MHIRAVQSSRSTTNHRNSNKKETPRPFIQELFQDFQIPSLKPRRGMVRSLQPVWSLFLTCWLASEARRNENVLANQISHSGPANLRKGPTSASFFDSLKVTLTNYCGGLVNSSSASAIHLEHQSLTSSNLRQSRIIRRMCLLSLLSQSQHDSER